MSSLPKDGGDEPTADTRSLRPRLRFTTPDQGQGESATTFNGESTRFEGLDAEQPAKRLKVSHEPFVEPSEPVATSAGSPAPASTEARLNLRDGAATLSAKELGEVKRRSWTLPKTKRASSLNLHNHPVISHPVGIAIWLLQKIDQARKSNASDDERSPSTSLPTSPGGIRPSTEIAVAGARLDRSDPTTAYSLKPSSLTGAQPLWGQSHVNEHEDDTARRQAQRHRKTKQRSENWAKNKENDVVARAKLEAKKKFGTQPQQEIERKKFVDERVRDDYGRLLGRQTAQFADAITQLAPFRVGHGEKFVQSNLHRYGSHHPYVQAGKLVLDVLPALAEPKVSERSQRAADTLLFALEHGRPDEGSFFTFIEVLSDDEVIQRGIDKVLGQLLSARPDDRRSSRSQASPAASVQFAPPPPPPPRRPPPPPPSGANPDSAGLSLKRLTWKEPATLKDHNFTPPPHPTQPGEAGVSEPPATPSSMSLALPQTSLVPRSPSAASLTLSAPMPPLPPAQSRCSGRERKPSAKVLAAGTETLSRQSAGSPPAAPRPVLTRSARSAPRVPSKLGLSEVIADQDDTPSPPAVVLAGQNQHGLPASTTSAVTAADDPRISNATVGSPLIPAAAPRPFHPLKPDTSPKPDLKAGFDPQLTANLLQLAEIAANMSDSESDDSDSDSAEMGRPGLPYHERLLRVLGHQASTSQWHNLTSPSGGLAATSSSATPASSLSILQAKPVNAAPPQPTSLPPVNTIMSAKDAQAASSFFKSLATDEPQTGTRGAVPAHSATMNPHVGVNRSVIPAQNMQPSNNVTNGMANVGRPHTVRNGARSPQTTGPEARIARSGSRSISPKTQSGGFSPYGRGGALPHLPRPEEQGVQARQATTSPQSTLLPRERKRKFEDEGNDIALSRLRSHAESHGLVVDPAMTFDQLNATIDHHEKALHNNSRAVNSPVVPPAVSVPYNNGLATNGHTSYGLMASSPTVETTPNTEGLRRLAPNPAWLRYYHPYPPYSILPPGSPTAPHSLSPASYPNPNVQRVLNGHATNTRSQIIQFVPPKQPSQFTHHTSPVMEKAPAIISGDDPRQQHQKALNGGPPGGGAVINSRTSKKQPTSNASNYKFQVNTRDTPIAQSQPKRGGQLMTF